MQPRVEEVRSPSTTVLPTGQTLVRIDVRDLVQHWRVHAPRDQGIAIVADTTSPTGLAFALTVASEAREQSSALPGETPALESRAGGEARVGPQRGGPRLELYIK
jgi:hypothetical protein